MGNKRVRRILPPELGCWVRGTPFVLYGIRTYMHYASMLCNIILQSGSIVCDCDLFSTVTSLVVQALLMRCN